MFEANDMIDEIMSVIPYLYEFLLYIKIAKISSIILKVIVIRVDEYADINVIRSTSN